MPNPKKPLGDITGAVKRTIRQPKPEEERVLFKVPVLVPTSSWELANNNLAEREEYRSLVARAGLLSAVQPASQRLSGQ
jgi:hypothetical protein